MTSRLRRHGSAAYRRRRLGEAAARGHHCPPAANPTASTARGGHPTPSGVVSNTGGPRSRRRRRRVLTNPIFPRGGKRRNERTDDRQIESITPGLRLCHNRRRRPPLCRFKTDDAGAEMWPPRPIRSRSPRSPPLAKYQPEQHRRNSRPENTGDRRSYIAHDAAAELLVSAIFHARNFQSGTIAPSFCSPAFSRASFSSNHVEHTSLTRITS